MYLQLVLASLVLGARVEKVDGENLQRCVSGRCSSWYRVVWRARGRWRSAESSVVCCLMSPSPPPPSVSQLVCDVPYWRLPDFNW